MDDQRADLKADLKADNWVEWTGLRSAVMKVAY